MHEPLRKSTAKGRILLWALCAAVLFTLLNYRAIEGFRGDELERSALKSIGTISSFHSGLAAADIRLMSASLDILDTNAELKTLFRNGDRQALNEASEDLFNLLKSNHGITHFYFIGADGVCFLRVHKPDFFDDLITRFTFKSAKKNQQRAFGIELGKTAYALRVIQPYYHDQELLGYIELGKEIDEFEVVTKEELGVELFLLNPKSELDEAKYRDQRQRMGLEDNWEDFDDLVVLSSSVETGDFDLSRFFDVASVFDIEDISFLGTTEDSSGENGPQIWIKGGFPFFDGSGRQTGVLLTLDAADPSSIAGRFPIALLAMNIALAAVLSLSAFFVFR